MKHPLRTLLLAVCCGLAAACTQRQERLKLMSYNIRNGIGIDNIQDIGRIARVILREAPDLVALQELDSATLRVDGRYIPGELGRMTGMHATFGTAMLTSSPDFIITPSSSACPPYAASRSRGARRPGYCSWRNSRTTRYASPTFR